MESPTSTHTPANLLHFPVELVLMIAQYLPPVDLASLALCTHNLMSMFKTSLEHMSRASSEIFPEDILMRHRFLIRLSRGWEMYYTCFRCSRLHPWRRVELPGLTFNLHCTFKPPRLSNLTLSLASTIAKYDFAHGNFVMRNFRHGSQLGFGFRAEDLRYTEVSTWAVEHVRYDGWRLRLQAPRELRNEPRNCIKMISSIEATVCTEGPVPSLCMRIQEIVMTAKENMAWYSPLAMSTTSQMAVCAHIEFPQTQPRERESILRLPINQYLSESKSSLVHDGKCDNCTTYWRLEVHGSRDGKDIAIVSTRWVEPRTLYYTIWWGMETAQHPIEL